MLDRRGFLAAMLGAAVAPKDVLAGLVTPSPVKEAVKKYSEWVCVWRQVGPTGFEGDVSVWTYTMRSAFLSI